MKEERIFISVRSVIEQWEIMLSPGFFFHIKKHTSNQIEFHEARWHWIIEKVDDPIVTKIKLFIKRKLKGNTDLFCKRMAGFFCYSSMTIHIPPLTKYNEIEAEDILRCKYGLTEKTLLNIIIFLLRNFSKIK